MTVSYLLEKFVFFFFYRESADSLIMILVFRLGTISGGQSTQIKYLSKSTDTYNKILLQ